MSMDKVNKKDFHTNAAISSKSKEYPGIMPVVACADVTRFGNATMHNSNTCKATDIVGGGDRSRSLREEYIDWLKYMREQRNVIETINKKAAKELGCFLDDLECFINNFPGGLLNFIYPSTGAGKSGNILSDLEKNLIGKTKVWALPSSGPNDCDHVGLINDNQGINIAKVYGAEQLGYYNGSDLVSWMPTGAQFGKLSRNLNSLLGYSSIDLTHGENFFAYVVQTFMNVIFMNNQFLPEADRLKIIDNYKKLLECIADSEIVFFEDYKNTMDKLKENNKEEFENEFDCPVKFIQFLFKKICAGTSLENLDLNDEQNKGKYIDLICGVSTFLTGAEHPNQVLLEQWIFDKNKENECVMGDAFIGKNCILYLPFHTILQRYIRLNSAEFKKNNKKEDDTQIKNKDMLNYMLNLVGKFRYKKTKFDLSNIETKLEYHFGCQVTNDKKQCKVPTEYNTNISVDELTALLNKITEFYDFETKLKDGKYKLNDETIKKILQYLLDGRQFHDDTFKKIVEAKVFMDKLIDVAKNKSIEDKECCYKNVYEILANEYFDLMIEYKFIDKSSLSKEKLMRYFENVNHKYEIIELKPELVAELGLISKLKADDINKFLSNKSEVKKQKKMIEILKLVIGKIDKDILNGLDLKYFDSELLETVILSRYNDLYNATIGNIDFKQLNLETQIVLLKKMADNDFEAFSFQKHWGNINSEAWKSLSIEDWRKFVYNKIHTLNEFVSKGFWFFKTKVKFDLKERKDILQLMPINILALFDTQEVKNENEVSAFFKFFSDHFDCLTAKQILAFGNCPENKVKKLKDKLKYEKDTSLSENAVETLLSLQQIFQKFVKSKESDDNNRSVEKMLFEFFETQLLDEKNLDNITECLKYIFNGDENNYFAAMIIMEELILLDDNTVKPNDKDQYIFSDSFHLESDKKQKLLQISEKIKSALNWNDEQSRKKILQQLFSHISKINELMILFDKSVDENWHFKQFIDIYKSFLDRILSLYSNDIIESKIADKVPFIFLNNEESIKLFCQKLGDRININNFSEMINAINKVEVNDNEYKISNALGVGKVLFIIDKIKEIEETSSSMDYNNNPEKDKYYGLSGFMQDIRRNASLICNGYAIDESDNSIENHLGQYDENGEISYGKLDSILCAMFKNICEDQTTVNEFIKKYGDLNKQELEKIKETKNQVGNFKAFEELMLPLIEKDYKDKDVDFVKFVKKYDLLKVISIENLDENMINMAFDCMHRSSLSWDNFIKKYYVLDKPDKNEIIIEKDYHIEGLEDKEIQKIMTQILLEDKDIKDIKDILSKADTNIIWKLYESLLLKDKNKNIKPEIEKMSDEIGKYFENVVAIKHAWNSNQRLNTEKLAKIWFTKDDGDIKSKTNKLSTMIEIYQSKRTDETWKKFSEIYILRHLNQDTIKKYKELAPTYKKIQDLEAKASNLKEQVALFYQKLGGETFNQNIKSICSWFKFESENKAKAKAIQTQFLMRVDKSNNIYDDFKKFFDLLEKINEMYDDDEVKKICEKYKNEDQNGVEKLFSSIANRVHFFEDYQTIIKKIPALDFKFVVETNEYQFRDTAKKILGGQLASKLDIEKNFAFLLVRSLEKLNKILDNLPNENQNQHNEEIKSLKQIYEKYNKLCSDDLRSLEDMKVIFKNNDGKFEFETDFQQIQDILKKMDIKDCDVFNKCLSIFKTDVLPDYEREMKRRDNFSKFVKFIETGIANGYFSDAQICNMDIINIFDENDLQSYTLEAEIKKLHVMVGSAGRDRLKAIAKALCPKNRLEYVICDFDQPDQYISAMRKLFLHMDYLKAKTFIKDYDFKSFPNIENQGQNQINTYQRRFNAFGRTLQNTLLDLFESSEYKKIDFKGKFILGGCFFESMLREACRYRRRKVETEFDDLFKMIRERILSVLTNPPQSFNLRLNETKKLLEKTSFNTSLNELIACAFLSAHIYICSRHVDGDVFNENVIEESIINLEDEFYDKIISMLARSTGKEEKFKDIENVKKWVYGSSLKYFIQGTFNLKDIPENERTDDQMELEQTELIRNYNERILEHILSRIDKQVSVFDILENIYCDDGNKVVYRFSYYYLADFLENKVVSALETGGKEEKGKNFFTLLKFLKRVKFSEKAMYKARHDLFYSLSACAKKLGLLDENDKFVDEEALRIWIKNVLPIFSECDYNSYKSINYMAYHLGDNISVLDLIDILQEESKQEPRLIDWLKDCNNFVSNLRGPYKPYKNGKKQKRKDVSHKCEDVVNFLNKICRTGYFDFNLLNLFPLLDTIEEISVDDTDGTKKFNTFENLKSFCNDDFFNDKSNSDVRKLLCFLYAISRIPKDKTLLDVITEDEYQIKKIFPNGYKCNREVFESALQTVYDCLSKENITDENRNKYVNFVFDFFATIKTDDFLDNGNYSYFSEYQIRQLEHGKDVFPTIGKIFNLVYDKSTKKSIYTLLKYINDTFADERDAMKGYDYRLPILCSMLCESIKNMTIEDIISDEVKFIWEILDKLYGKYREELNWCDADRLKTELNAKIKEHLKKQKDDKTREDEAKKILYAFCNADRCMPDWLDFEWSYDALNSSDLTTDNTDSQKLVFKDAQCLNKFWSNSQKQIEVKSASMPYPGTTIDKLIYALSRLPQNTSVIDVLKMMKENKVGNICLKSGISYESQINFLKDVILKIEDEINSNKKKYTENKNMFDETLDCLFDFFRDIISNEALKSDFLQNQKDKRDSSAKNIIFSSLRIFKTLLSEHHFTDLSYIQTRYKTFRWDIYGDELSENKQIKNDLNDISRSMKLKMLDKCHIFEFLDNMRDTKENYEDWIKNDKILFQQLLKRMEKEFGLYPDMQVSSSISPNKFPYYYTNIEFFIRYSDKENFERVVRLAAKICGGRSENKKTFLIYNNFQKDNDSVKLWLDQFQRMFSCIFRDKLDVGIVRRIALEHIISNFSDKINVFDFLFLLRYQLFAHNAHKELTTLGKEISEKLVNKILIDKFCEGWAYKAYDEYEGLGRHGKINFVSQLLQGIGVEIEAEEKERLYDGLRKQEQEQKKLMEEDKRIKSHEWGVNNNNQNRNENKSNSTDIIQENPEQIISTLTNINKEDTIIKDNKSKKDNIDTSDNRDKNKNEVDNTLNQNETKNISIQKNIIITGRQSPLTVINHANRIHSFSDDRKENKKSKPILEYLFWFLTFCAVVFCIYFFATSAIVEAIIALIEAIIIGVISILIRRRSNAKEKPKSTIEIPLQDNNNKTYLYYKNLPLEMIKEEEIEDISEGDISGPDQ